METRTVRLTQYSHGAGCGCKIAPAVLSEILQRIPRGTPHPRLLVGYDTRDDAAVYAIDDRNAIISTTDFFMPIVDDAFDFGAIASVNAISDVYAMGGRPILAIAILGWPVGKLDAALAGDVLNGARDACDRAGIPLAGGHSIDAPEPIFGLAVTGMIEQSRIRSNDLAQAGDELYLTKPIGIGIMTTAQKRGVLQDVDMQRVRRVMLELNDIGAELSGVPAVRSMTDVTGFGLLGHLIEMCEGSGVRCGAAVWGCTEAGGAVAVSRERLCARRYHAQLRELRGKRQRTVRRTAFHSLRSSDQRRIAGFRGPCRA